MHKLDNCICIALLKYLLLLKCSLIILFSFISRSIAKLADFLMRFYVTYTQIINRYTFCDYATLLELNTAGAQFELYTSTLPNIVLCTFHSK